MTRIDDYSTKIRRRLQAELPLGLALEGLANGFGNEGDVDPRGSRGRRRPLPGSGTAPGESLVEQVGAQSASAGHP